MTHCETRERDEATSRGGRDSSSPHWRVESGGTGCAAIRAVRVFVIGGTGVIGSRVLQRLIARGHEVSALSRSEANRQVVEGAGAKAVAANVADSSALAAALRGHEVVVNLATHIPPSSRAFLPGAWRATNELRRTLPPRIARAAAEAGVRTYVQESFAPAYPDCGDRLIDESTPIATVRYNRGIADAEAATFAFTSADRRGIVLRFAYFYGSDSDFTRDMIATVRKGWAPAPGAPEAYMSSVSHDDAADAVVAALSLPAGAYNVTDDEPVTRRQFVDSLADRLGVPHPRFAPAWIWRLLGSLGETLSRSQRMSNGKLRDASDWRPRYPSVREGWAAVVRGEPNRTAPNPIASSE